MVLKVEAWGQRYLTDILEKLTDADFVMVALDKQGKPKGEPLVACDATRAAGPGEFIYFEGGREAALALDPSFVPVDHTIIGIVDDLHLPA